MRGIVWGLLFALAAPSLFGCLDGGGEPPSAPIKLVPTRDEFRGKVVGKKAAEVIDAVGRPTKTNQWNDDTEWWHYDEATRDPAAGKVDFRATVKFRGGVVTSVEFNG